MTRIRAEVEGPGGGYIVHITPPELTTAQRVVAQRILADAIHDLQLHQVIDPRGVLAVLLTEAIAEGRAYHREAERRGLLAL